MSKSYGKYKTLGICSGSNTSYYRSRNRRVRVKNNQKMKNIIANKNIDEFDDIFISYSEPDNYKWGEPTDGTWKITPKENGKWWWRNNLYVVKNKNRIKK